MSDYHALVFDFFGVISSEVAPFWFEKYFPKEEAKNLKEKYIVPADLGKVSDTELFVSLGELVRKTPEEVSGEFQSFIKLNTDVVALMEGLKPLYKLGLCSNSIPNFVRPILASHTLAHLFDAVVISSECGMKKPDERIYALVLEKLSVRAEDVVFIDDNPAHVEGAERMGMKAILFTGFQELNSALAKLEIRTS